VRLSRRQLHEAAIDEKCRRNPLNWLQHWTRTFDEHWQSKGLESPYRSFPPRPYWPWVFQSLLEEPRVFIAKSRDMMLSWAVIGYAVWLCQFFERTRAVVQTQKKEKVIDLINGRGNPGYARTLYEHQEDWMKRKHPLTKPIQNMPGDLLSWANGSTLQGVPKGADEIRQYHPTVAIFDEAAHLDEFEAAYGAALPVC